MSADNNLYWNPFGGLSCFERNDLGVEDKQLKNSFFIFLSNLMYETLLSRGWPVNDDHRRILFSALDSMCSRSHFDVVDGKDWKGFISCINDKFLADAVSVFMPHGVCSDLFLKDRVRSFSKFFEV